MITEQAVWKHDPNFYHNAGVCPWLEHHYRSIFSRLDNLMTRVDPDGLLRDDQGRVIAGIYEADVHWSDEARQLVHKPRRDTPSFRTKVFVKNPLSLWQSKYDSPGVGVVNGLVLVDGVVWCAQATRTNGFTLIRRVADLSGDRNYQIDFQRGLYNVFTASQSASIQHWPKQ